MGCKFESHVARKERKKKGAPARKKKREKIAKEVSKKGIFKHIK